MTTHRTGTEPQRISPAKARERVQQWDALLVCAYEDDAKCAKYALGPAISFSEFKMRRDDLPRAHEIIFYCT